MTDVAAWSTTASSNNASPPDGFPEGQTPASLNNAAREVMAATRRFYAAPDFLDLTYGKTITRVSDVQVTVGGVDATAIFTAGRRVRIVGATTADGFVTSSSYSAPDTTLLVSMDDGVVPTSPTVVYVGHAALHGAAFTPLAYAAENGLVNGCFQVWQRGTASTTCTASARTFLADRWYVNPSGADVTQERSTTVPTGSYAGYSLKLTGAASVTTVLIGQRIEALEIPRLKRRLTFSAYVYNVTGAAFVPVLLIGTPGAADDFTTVTNRATTGSGGVPALGSCADTAWTRVSVSIDVSGFTNIANGMQVELQVPSGSLVSGDVVHVTEMRLEPGPLRTPCIPLPFGEELRRCQRYYTKTFAYGTAPAQNAGTAGAFGALSAGTGPFGTWFFPVRMRTTPTVTTYAPSAASANWSDGTGCTTSNASDASIVLGPSTTNSAGGYTIHASATAEL